MKKILFFASALAGLFATSCQQEILEPVQEGNVVTFEVSVPQGVATKVGDGYQADGSNVNDLVYAVYSTKADNLKAALEGELKFFYAVNETTGTSFDSEGKSIVSLELLNDQNYVILFWAQSNDAWVKAQGGNIDLFNVTYPTSMAANNEHLEAFSGVSFITNVKGARKEKVTLTRPFAQINLATTMPKAFTATLSQSSMSIVGAPKSFNVATQLPSSTYTTADEPLNFTIADVPVDEEFKSGYTYAGANYVFAGNDVNNLTTVEVSYTISTSHGNVNNTVPSVPVQKNYRTNIIGNLLTSQADYTVELNKVWGGVCETIEVWNGSEINEPKVSEDNIYEIEFASELAWLAAAVNGTLPETRAAVKAQNFAGKTFRLTKDIDLADHEWTPIGSEANIFKGTFDGQNHTVKNLKITGNNSNVGLFGVTHDGEIKNLVIQNAKVSGRLHVGVVAGTPYTTKYSSIKVKGHVEVNGFAYVGGVGGHNVYADWTDVAVEVDETSYVKANSVENGSAYRTYVGGVAGFCAEGGHTHKNITSNINVDGSTCDVGGLFGIAHYNNKFENCSCSGNVSITTNEVDSALEMGGIAGVWHNENGTTVTFTDCSFTGELQTPNINEKVNFHNGGLVGSPYKADGTGRLIIDGNVVVASASTLQAAINGAKDGDTITLVADINSEDGIIITDKNITIDLNDKTFTVSEGASTSNRNFKINGSSVVTIMNGTMVAKGDIKSGAYGTVRTEDSAKVTLNDVKAYSYRGYGLNVKACTGTKITINDSEIYAQYSGGVEAAGGEIELNNVKIVQNGVDSSGAWCSVAIGVNDSGKVTVNSGEYSAAAISTDSNAAQGTWVAYVMTSGGTLDIKGGTFNGTVAETAAAANACGLICADTKAVVNIYEGTFTSNGAILDMRNNTGGSPNPVATLYGGTFSADPTVSGLYSNNLISVAEGYVVKEENGNYVVSKKPEANVNGTPYVGTFAEAVASAKSGDTITVIDDVTLTEALTLPAGIVFNGNGKQIEGTISAAGDLTLEGHTKVTSFSAGFSGNTITIKKGACLEVTGSGRTTFGYANTFDIKGELTDAKTADKTKIQPSLIIPAGLSVTGGNGFTLNVKDAYVQIGSTTSKNTAANGTFTLNIENSIAEFTTQLTFAEPKNGMNPFFNLNLKNSVLTTGTKLCIAAPNTSVSADNSTITIGTDFRNSGYLKLDNKSSLTGSTTQHGENSGNTGTTEVDNQSKMTITAPDKNHPLIGETDGIIKIKNQSEVSVTFYKSLKIEKDGTSTFTGTEVQ